MDKEGMLHCHRKNKRNVQFHNLALLAKKARENLKPTEMKKVLCNIKQFIDTYEYKRDEILIELQLAEAFKMLVEEKLETKGKQ